MKLTFDGVTGVAYVEIVDGFVDHSERLGPDREVDYDSEGHVMGYELLEIAPADLSELPHREELVRLFADQNVQVLV